MGIRRLEVLVDARLPFMGPGRQWSNGNFVLSEFSVDGPPGTLAETYTCNGFQSPMANGPVKVKKNRVLPLKAQLQDDALQYVDDSWLLSPPVLQVLYANGMSIATDVSDDAYPAGAGTDGNMFEFSNDGWQFNLKTKNFTAPGTYTVTMVSGDPDEYLLSPMCEGVFVIH